MDMLIKIIFSTWFLIGSLLTLGAMLSEKGTDIANESGLVATIIAMLFSIFLSPYWMIRRYVELLRRGN